MSDDGHLYLGAVVLTYIWMRMMLRYGDNAVLEWMLWGLLIFGVALVALIYLGRIVSKLIP